MRKNTPLKFFAAFAAFLFLLSLVSGCATTAYKRAYVTGAIASDFITEAHGVYDDLAKGQLAKCDPSINPESPVATKADFDACMTDTYSVKTQDAIVKALAVYTAIATAYTAVMMGCEPNADGTKVNAATCVKRTYSAEELRAWRGKLVTAAFAALATFPDAEAKTKNLGRLLGFPK